MSAVGHLAAFLDALRDSQLLNPEQLTELQGTPQAEGDDPRPLAQLIYQKGWLTKFQIKQAVKGHAHDLVLGPYRIQERIGEGGMGQVFKAHHVPMNRTVALKVIKKERLSNPKAVARFQQEVQAAAQLLHPNIVCAYDANQVGSTHYFAMEYIEGVDLHQLVIDNGPLPVAEACDYIRQAAMGLQHAHERGLVHRDIKPSNLLVTRPPTAPTATLLSGSSPGRPGAQRAVVKILDMGLARLGEPEADNRITRDEIAMGTPDFMAPEQAINSRNADIRSDLYSLGCTFFFLLAGRAPYEAKTLAQMLLMHQLDQVPSVSQYCPEVPPGVEQIINKLLAKRPVDRFQTPGELVEALDPYCRGGTGKVDRALASRRGARGDEFDWNTLGGPDDGETPTPRSPVESLDKTAVVSQDDDPPVAARARRARRPGPAIDRRILIIASVGGGVAAVLAVVLLIALLRGNKSPNDRPTQGTAQTKDGAVVVAPATTGRTEPRPGPNQAVVPEVRPNPPVGNPPPVAAVPATTITPPGLGHIKVVQFTPDGQQALVVGQGTRFVLVDLQTKLVVREFLGHKNVVMHAVLSPDGKQVLSGSQDGTMRLWDVATGRQQKEFQPRQQHGWVLCVAFSPDGRSALCGHRDTTVVVWDLSKDTPVREVSLLHTGQVTGVFFTPDGNHALSAGGTSVRLWEVKTGNPIRQFAGAATTDVRCIALSRDGRELLIGDDTALRLWDVATGKELRPLAQAQGQVLAVAFTPGGGRAVSGGGYEGVRLYNIQTGQEVHRFSGHMSVVSSVAFSPDGRRCMSGSFDETLRVWEVP